MSSALGYNAAELEQLDMAMIQMLKEETEKQRELGQPKKYEIQLDTVTVDFVSTMDAANHYKSIGRKGKLCVYEHIGGGKKKCVMTY